MPNRGELVVLPARPDPAPNGSPLSLPPSRVAEPLPCGFSPPGLRGRSPHDTCRADAPTPYREQAVGQPRYPRLFLSGAPCLSPSLVAWRQRLLRAERYDKPHRKASSRSCPVTVE